MIRVLQFADIINRHDFIDTIVQRSNPDRFLVGACVRSAVCNIAAPVYQEGTPHWVLGGATRRALPRAVLSLAALLRQWKADILHTHHFDQAVIGWLATRLAKRTRLVVGRHYSDALYRLPETEKRALLALEQKVNRAATRIVVPSTYIWEILTQRQGVGPGKIDQVPYGFVADKYPSVSPSEIRAVREALGLEGRFVVGTFARLHEEKGHRFLFEAAARLRSRLPELTLLLVGDGPERPALERAAASAGLTDAVRLLGWRRDAMTLMAAVDVVVQPTLQEAFSQVMAEALWMGRPLVITDVSGAPDIIRDGQNGIVVPRGDSAALERAMERLARDPDLRSTLASAGRGFVQEHLSIEKVIPRYERAYVAAMEA